MSGARAKEVKFSGRPVWAEITVSALADNFRAIRKSVTPPGDRLREPRKVLAVVKGNAYGHGAAPAAKALAKAGAEWFGVPCSAEGIELREAGIKTPILVMTGFWPGEERRIIEHRLTTAVTRCEQLPLLERAATVSRSSKPVEFHLKIDSGMNPLAIPPAHVDSFPPQLPPS